MDAFNFAFSLFAIVLGLSLVEVLGGFARVLKRRRGARSVGLDGTSHPNAHVGWLTPMLAIYVMLDLTSFWEWGWGARRFVNPGYGVLVIGLLISGLYYVAASIIFPSEMGERADFDAHYMAHRRQVFGAVLTCNIILFAIVAAFRWHDMPARVYVENLVYLAAAGTALASNSKKANIAALAALIAMYGYAAVMTFIQPIAL